VAHRCPTRRGQFDGPTRSGVGAGRWDVSMLVTGRRGGRVACHKLPRVLDRAPHPGRDLFEESVRLRSFPARPYCLACRLPCRELGLGLISPPRAGLVAMVVDAERMFLTGCKHGRAMRKRA